MGILKGDFFSIGIVMSVLKRMTARKKFLEFPDNLKKCQIEARDKCRILKFFERVQDQCTKEK